MKRPHSKISGDAEGPKPVPTNPKKDKKKEKEGDGQTVDDG